MYTTVASVTLQLGQFSKLLLAGISEGDVIKLLEEADRTIDGYIAAAVTLPFADVPKLIVKIANDIAVRNIWAQKQTKDIPAHVKDDYDEALKLLLKIAQGTLKLTAEDPEDDSFRDLKFTTAERTFGSSI